MRQKANRLDRRDWLCVLVFVAAAFVPYLPAVLYGLTLDPIHYGGSLDTHQIRGIVLGGPWLDPNTGYTVQALGKLSADQWLHGEVPWWNSYTGIGVPLAAEMQTLSFFLPFVLLLHFAYGAIFLKIALQIVAAVATYRLLRELGLVRIAAFCGATLYEFHGAFAWFAHAPIAPAPFLPLLLLGIERARKCALERQKGGWVLIGVALAYSLYAGFPEVAYLDGLLALAWAGVRLATIRAAWKSLAAKVAIGGIAGMLLSAPLIVPFLQYQSLSSIQHTLPPDSGRNISVFAALLMPYIFGPISAYSEPSGYLQDLWGGGGGYIDGTLLLLALFGLICSRRFIALRLLLASWTTVFVLRIMALLHVGNLLDLIPAINVLAVERYCGSSISMAAAILASFGIDHWRQTAPRIKAVLGVTLSFLSLEAVALWLGRKIISGLWSESDVHHYGTWFWTSTAWAAFTALTVAILWTKPGRRATSLAMSAFVLANSIVLFSVPVLSGYRYVETDHGLIQFLQRHSGIERFYTLSPFAPNYGAYFGVASINHNMVPVPRSWIDYVRANLDPDVVDPIFIGYVPNHSTEDRYRYLQMNMANFAGLGVRYIVVPKNANPFKGPVAPVYQGLVADVFEIPGPQRYFDIQGGPCELSAASRTVVRTACENEAILSRKELYYPGWRASVNGMVKPVARDSIFQTVALPRGLATVKFSYLPTHFGWLCVSAALGFALLLFGCQQSIARPQSQT